MIDTLILIYFIAVFTNILMISLKSIFYVKLNNVYKKPIFIDSFNNNLHILNKNSKEYNSFESNERAIVLFLMNANLNS